MKSVSKKIKKSKSRRRISKKNRSRKISKKMGRYEFT